MLDSQAIIADISGFVKGENGLFCRPAGKSKSLYKFCVPGHALGDALTEGGLLQNEVRGALRTADHLRHIQNAVGQVYIFADLIDLLQMDSPDSASIVTKVLAGVAALLSGEEHIMFKEDVRRQFTVQPVNDKLVLQLGKFRGMVVVQQGDAGTFCNLCQGVQIFPFSSTPKYP